MIQVLCPQRHAILGIAYNTDALAPEVAMAGLKELVRLAIYQKRFNPWCGICGSRDWRYEDAETIFKSIAEAEPVLRVSEAMQLLTANFFKHGKN